MIIWSIEERKIKDLKPHPNNPRKMTRDQSQALECSIDGFGLIEKPIINTDGVIIGGHQRIRLCKKMGIKTVPCWVPDRLLTPQEVCELVIRLNKNVGEWDWDKLANEWEMEDVINWGFTAADLVGHWGDEKEDKAKSSKNKEISICPHCGEEI